MLANVNHLVLRQFKMIIVLKFIGQSKRKILMENYMNLSGLNVMDFSFLFEKNL